MMQLTLRRSHAVGNRTFGELLHNGKRLCYTLEDQVREVPGRPVAEWKVHGQTAIPAGRYAITLENSPRFGANTLTVNAVPGFGGVRMHAGNTVDDTEGCPLLGMAINDGGIVGGTSRPAVDLVKTVVRLGIQNDGGVVMAVTNPLPEQPL